MAGGNSTARRAPTGGRGNLPRSGFRRRYPPTDADPATVMAGAHLLLEQRRRPEALAVGLVQDLLDLQAQARAHQVHQLEWPDRVTEPEPARGVELLGADHALPDQPHRLH